MAVDDDNDNYSAAAAALVVVMLRMRTGDICVVENDTADDNAAYIAGAWH